VASLLLTVVSSVNIVNKLYRLYCVLLGYKAQYTSETASKQRADLFYNSTQKTALIKIQQISGFKIVVIFIGDKTLFKIHIIFKTLITLKIL